MDLYSVIVTKIGSVELYADSEEEAKRMAESSNEKQILWGDGISAADAEKINKES